MYSGKESSSATLEDSRGVARLRQERPQSRSRTPQGVAAATHLNEDLDDLLHEFAIDHLVLALFSDQLEDGRAHVALHGIEDDVVKLLIANLLQLRAAKGADVEAVEILKDVRGT